MDIARHKYDKSTIGSKERWREKCEAFARLRSGERHGALMSLVWAGYHAGYTESQELYDKVYEAYGEAPDELDIQATVNAVLERAGEMADGAEIKGSGRRRAPDTAMLDRQRDRHGEAWKSWVGGLVSGDYAIPEAPDSVPQTLTPHEMIRKSVEVMRSLVGEISGDDRVFFGTMYSDKHASSYIKPDWSPIGDYLRTYWCPNVLGSCERKNDAVRHVRYILAEIDEPLADTDLKPHTEAWMEEMQRQQASFWSGLIDRLPVAAVISSGSKSLHVLLAVDGTVEDFEAQRNRLVEAYTELHLDRSCLDVARKTRAPYGVRQYVVSDSGLLTDYDKVRHAVDDCRSAKRAQAGREALEKAGLPCQSMSSYHTCYHVQDVLYLNAGVEHVGIGRLATQLEELVAEIVPDKGLSEFEQAIEDRIDPGLGYGTFCRFLEHEHASIWYDEIARWERCSGLYNKNPWKNTMRIRDRWHDLFGKYPEPGLIDRAIGELLSANLVNPVKDWLETLAWDGADHIGEYCDLAGIDGKFDRMLVRKWLLQCVAVIYNDDDEDDEESYGSDGVLTFYGSQGLGKTSWFRSLVPRSQRKKSWWREGMSLDTNNKDSRLQLGSGWIAEMGEADSTTGREQSSLKAQLTNSTLVERKPYERGEEHIQKHVSVCASVNKQKFLRDPSGNRRWWVIEVTRMDAERINSYDSSQLWAQVKRIWDDSDDHEHCYRLTPKEREKLDARNLANYYCETSYELLILEHFNFSAPEDLWQWKDLGGILHDIMPEHADTVKCRRDLAAALRFRGCKDRTSNGVKFLVPPKHTGWDDGEGYNPSDDPNVAPF